VNAGSVLVSWNLEFRVLGVEKGRTSRVSGFWFRVSGLVFLVSGYGFQVWGFCFLFSVFLASGLQGYLAHKKTPTPLDHHRGQGIGLL